MSPKNRVLLVDDEERFVSGMASLLIRRGYDVGIAFDGWQAMEKIDSEESYDVVLLDVNMPGRDGISTLNDIKTQRPETEVIILTGRATLEDGVEALRLGAYDYLMKPCDIEDLIRKIDDALEVERIKDQPVLWAGAKVSEVVRSLFRILKSNEPLSKALELYLSEPQLMVQERLYIEDQNGHLCGFITKQDLLNDVQQAQTGRVRDWQELAANPEIIAHKALKDIMHPEIVAADPDEPLVVVGQVMIAHNLRSMPVTKNGRMIGIVRLPDILTYIQQETD